MTSLYYQLTEIEGLVLKKTVFLLDYFNLTFPKFRPAGIAGPLLRAAYDGAGAYVAATGVGGTTAGLRAAGAGGLFLRGVGGGGEAED